MNKFYVKSGEIEFHIYDLLFTSKFNLWFHKNNRKTTPFIHFGNFEGEYFICLHFYFISVRLEWEQNFN